MKKGCLWSLLALIALLVIAGFLIYEIYTKIFSPLNDVIKILNKPYSSEQILSNPVTQEDYLSAKQKFDGTAVFNSSGDFYLANETSAIEINVTLTESEIATMINDLFKQEEVEILIIKQLEINFDSSFKIIYEMDLKEASEGALDYIIYIIIDFKWEDDQIHNISATLNQTTQEDTKVVINTIFNVSVEEFGKSMAEPFISAIKEFGNCYSLDFKFEENAISFVSK